MRVLRRSGSGVELVEGVERRPGDGEVRIALAAAGICRTDLYVADGSIAGRSPVVLGHEAAGWIDAVGPGVDRTLGELVAIDPSLPCSRCAACVESGDCESPIFLGVDRDGAFADAISVPARCAVAMPAAMEPRRAAYLEPVAAALAVTGAGLDPDARGAIVGGGRIAELTARVLLACGYRPPMRVSDIADLGGDYDYIIETCAPPSLDPLVAAVRPGGTVVLKSRPAAPVALDLRLAVSRRVTLRAVSYAPFSAAADLLASDRLELGDLYGESFALDDWPAAFSAARADESLKQFFALGSR